MEFIAVVFDRFLGREDERFEFVLRIDDFATFLIFGFVLFRIVDHAIDIALVQARRSFNRNALFFARSLVFCRDVDDTVGVDIEGNFDLGHATRSRRDTFQVEFGKRSILSRHFAFTLEDVNRDFRLVVVGCREDFALTGGDRRIARNEFRRHATECFDTERKRRHVEQQDVFHIAGQNTTLDSSTQSDDFVGVDAVIRFFAEEFFDFLLNQRNTRRTTDQDDFIDIGNGFIRIAQRFLTRFERFLDDVGDHVFEFGARQIDVEVFGPRRIGGEERQVDVGRSHRRKRFFRFFGFVTETLQNHLIVRNVDATVFLELFHEPVDDQFVDVIAAQVRVAIRRNDFDDVVADFQDRDIERTTTEVIDGDRFVFFLVQAIGKCSGRRFVDDTTDVETGDFTSIFRRLTL